MSTIAVHNRTIQQQTSPDRTAAAVDASEPLTAAQRAAVEALLAEVAEVTR